MSPTRRWEKDVEVKGTFSQETEGSGVCVHIMSFIFAKTHHGHHTNYAGTRLDSDQFEHLLNSVFNHHSTGFRAIYSTRSFQMFLYPSAWREPAQEESCSGASRFNASDCSGASRAGSCITIVLPVVLLTLPVTNNSRAGYRALLNSGFAICVTHANGACTYRLYTAAQRRPTKTQFRHTSATKQLCKLCCRSEWYK